ncbi:MAG: hypothetical protein HYZ65_02350 [Burkholderiales bacterium]|nr:hypothetical protein [Burkholderiales bacterium]
MKRLPLILSFFAFILLCMSLSFWGLRVFKPQVRSVAAPAMQSGFEPGAGQWGSIFGSSQSTQITASNYQLKGVVVARRKEDSVAIVVAEGKPAQSVALEQELAPGVLLKEVHDQYVMISESGSMRRIDLPQSSVINLPSAQNTNPTAAIGVVPQNVPATFPEHRRNVPPMPMAPSSSPSATPVPMVTPGLPTASLPEVMPANPQ